MEVKIYGAEWCSACKKAVALCESKSIEFKYIDIDNTSSLRELEEKLGTKVKTIPQIFLNGQHIQKGYTGLYEELAKN